jgi:hypothetical protein
VGSFIVEWSGVWTSCAGSGPFVSAMVEGCVS